LRRPSFKVAALQRSPSPEVAKDAGGKRKVQRAVAAENSKAKKGGKGDGIRSKAGAASHAAGKEKQLSVAALAAQTILQRRRGDDVSVRDFLDRIAADTGPGSTMGLLLEYMGQPEQLPSKLCLKVVCQLVMSIADSTAPRNSDLEKVRKRDEYPCALAVHLHQVATALTSAASARQWALSGEETPEAEGVVSHAGLTDLLVVKFAHHTQGLVELTADELTSFSDVLLTLDSRVKVGGGWVKPTTILYFLTPKDLSVVSQYADHAVPYAFRTTEHNMSLWDMVTLDLNTGPVLHELKVRLEAGHGSLELESIKQQLDPLKEELGMEDSAEHALHVHPGAGIEDLQTNPDGNKYLEALSNSPHQKDLRAQLAIVEEKLKDLGRIAGEGEGVKKARQALDQRKGELVMALCDNMLWLARKLEVWLVCMECGMCEGSRTNTC